MALNYYDLKETQIRATLFPLSNYKASQRGCQLEEKIKFGMIQLKKAKDSVSMVEATALAV